MDKEKKEEDNKKGAGPSNETQKDQRQDGESVSTNSYSSLEIESKDMPSTAARLGTRKLRLPKKKNYKRATGRVQKRKPKKTKRKTRPRYAATPSATSFSSRNTLSLTRNLSCKYCGHRCCLRRFMYKRRRLYTKYQPWKFKKTRVRKRNCRLGTSTVSASCQMGPPSLMLSKLYVAGSPTGEDPVCQDDCKQISPEMIHHTLQELSMWRQDIPLELIFDFIRKHYPVTPNSNELMEELMEKLRVAQIAGLVWALPYNCWRLPTMLEQVSRLEMTHVTLFWRAYWDTMKPLDKNRQQAVLKEDKQAATEESLRIRDDTDSLDII